MISVVHLFRRPAARVAALLAVLAFGWHGALPGAAIAEPHVFAPVADEARLSAEELRPAYTILPAAPSQVAKPASTKPRPLAGASAAGLAPESLLPLRLLTADIAHSATRGPASLFLPPYAARGPPILS